MNTKLKLEEKEKRVPHCNSCGGNMWHTIKKGEKWGCRYCGVIRDITRKEKV